jgi:NTE family protein
VGERWDVVAGASSGSICGAVTVAGLASQGPDLARDLAGMPIVSTRYLETERSIFGVGRILREALEKHLPERLVREAEAELLVATTHAGHYLRRLVPARLWQRLVPGAEAGGARHDPLVVHSSREHLNLHDVLVASCYIPVVHAGVPRLDGAMHLDGAFADNTLIDTLVARGATEITVITPYSRGAVARTMFASEGQLHPRPGVRLRVLYPERPLSIGRFDLDRGRLEEALRMPYRELVL